MTGKVDPAEKGTVWISLTGCDQNCRYRTEFMRKKKQRKKWPNMVF